MNIDVVIDSHQKNVMQFVHDINSFNRQLHQSVIWSRLNTNMINIESDNVPSIIMIGSQSAGKSTFINQICGYNISPTGTGQVTKSPLHILLKKSDKAEKIIIGDKIFNVDKLEEIHQAIRAKSNNTNLITSTPIKIVVESSKILDNICLIDLPGMIAVAKDAEQQESIELINNILLDYIKKPNVITVVMMQAGTDLETNIALAFMKKHKPSLNGCIGVFTKSDLYDGPPITNNPRNNVTTAYTNGNKDNNVPSAFKMEHGYFTIGKNKTLEMKTLLSYLSKQLVNMIKLNFSNIMNDIEKISKLLLTYQQENYPNDNNDNDDNNTETEDNKVYFVHKYISDICRRITMNMENITDRNMKDLNNLGTLFKNHTEQFRNNILSIEPFKKDIYTKEYFDNIIKSINGYHMDNFVSNIKILEYCIEDKEKNPLNKLNELSNIYVESFTNIMIDKIRDIMTNSDNNNYGHINRFPSLQNILLSLITEYVKKQQILTIEAIVKLSNYNNSYVYITHDDMYDNTSINDDPYTVYSVDKNHVSYDIYSEYRHLLNKYFNSIKEIYLQLIPKICMFYMFRELQDTLHKSITHKITTDIIDVIEEDTSYKICKQEIKDLIKQINHIKQSQNNKN